MIQVDFITSESSKIIGGTLLRLLGLGWGACPILSGIIFVKDMIKNKSLEKREDIIQDFQEAIWDNE